MKAVTFATALPRLTLAVTILCVGCSDAPKSSTTTPALLGTPALTTQSTSAPVAASLDAGSPAWPDWTWAAAISVQPQAQCNVYPQGGASGDITRSDLIPTGSDGMLRFYSPPPSWGSVLSVDCRLNGSSVGQYIVNLNDATTFTRLSGSDIEPKLTGTQPPFSGDPSTVSALDFAAQGYPVPPDRATHPALYAQWQKLIATPVPTYQLMNIVQLGMKGYGALGGECNSSNWGGVVMSAGGFSSACVTRTPTSPSEVYELYNAFTYINGASGCNNGSPPCTTYEWAGLGGSPQQYLNGSPSTLMQSGLALQNNAVGYYWEFFPGPPHIQSLLSGWNSGDELQIQGSGVTSDSCSSAADYLAPYACFKWWDLRTFDEAYVAIPAPSSGTWVPASWEFVIEDPGPGGPVGWGWPGGVLGAAYDWDGVPHEDSGNANGTDSFQPWFLSGWNDEWAGTGSWSNSTDGDPWETF